MGISKKIVLLGHFGVGKTSLIRRFVHNAFSEDYLTTIGVTIEKKVVEVNGASMAMIIWDIAGENSQQKVPETYKLGAQGVLYVFDLTRKSTYENIQEDVRDVQKILPKAPIKFIGNKVDLVDDTSLDLLKNEIPLSEFFTSSAKTGENVEEFFKSLAEEMI